MSNTTGSNKDDVGKTTTSTRTAKASAPQVMTGNMILKGKCTYAGCPYEDNSELSTAMGVVQLQGTNYIFHPECHTKWVNEERAQVRRDFTERIDALKDSGAREVTLQDAKRS